MAFAKQSTPKDVFGFREPLNARFCEYFCKMCLKQKLMKTQINGSPFPLRFSYSAAYHIYRSIMFCAARSTDQACTLAPASATTT